MIKLSEEELLDKSHLPVMMVMNMIDESRFLRVLESVSHGIGFGEEEGVCTMPDDLDEFDKANGEVLEGVEFALYSGQEVVIDFNIFYTYLKIICEKYVENHEEQKKKIEILLSEYERRFVLNNSWWFK